MSKAASISAAPPIRTLEILVASESGLALRARLYTKSGVLVAEGVAASDGGGLAQPLSSGLLPQQILTARDIRAGDYFLELTPEVSHMARPSAGRVEVFTRSLAR